MKIKICTCLFFSLYFGQLLSQELTLFQKSQDSISYETIDFQYEDSKRFDAVSFLQLDSGLFTLQAFNYESEGFSFGINARVEEELPYEDTKYDYSGFYYLDFGCNYELGNINLGFSVENILNLNDKDFGIDPIVDITNGIINESYFSHEANALVSLTITYTF